MSVTLRYNATVTGLDQGDRASILATLSSYNTGDNLGELVRVSMRYDRDTDEYSVRLLAVMGSASFDDAQLFVDDLNAALPAAWPDIAVDDLGAT